MVHVYPTTVELKDVADVEPLGASEVGMLVSCCGDSDCGFCQFGCCAQRYIFDTTCDEPIVIHGALGEA